MADTEIDFDQFEQISFLLVDVLNSDFIVLFHFFFLAVSLPKTDKMYWNLYANMGTEEVQTS